ncbi:MAG: hypothetical protein QOF14_4665 [Hyphomicrobiales bacterium]|jgi:hypothetical protein|nr:hypothetical protein [Hyphomicrobiales bacterium]
MGIRINLVFMSLEFYWPIGTQKLPPGGRKKKSAE